MARARKDADMDTPEPVSGAVLLRNFGWIEPNGQHRFLAAGTVIDPQEQDVLMAFLIRSGAQLRTE